MQWVTIACFLLFLGCVVINGQSQDCQRLRDTCNRCVRSLSPMKNIDFMNDGCREKVRRTYIWRNQTRCDLQVIACRSHNRKLDCAVIAQIAGMRRRT
ncbi:hypothetical protein KR200_005863 [Drosophila serrata]|nr:hypothetical protein KR200_005863 [Drosophila serrata]